MKGNDRPRNMDEWMRWVESTATRLDRRIRGSALVYAAGNQVVTTDGSGIGTFPITSAAFYIDPPVVVASGGNGEVVTIVAVATDQFTAEFRSAATGDLLAGSLVRCLWHALPPTQT